MNLNEIFYEAYRRKRLFHPNSSIRIAWVGLGNKTDYRVALEKGYMTWTNGNPAPRCDGWLRLTSKGIQEFKARAATNKQLFEQEYPEYAKGVSEFELMKVI